MTLAAACLMLHGMGHAATVLHRDHLCQREESHQYSECPAAPWWAMSAADVAGLSTAASLRHLIEEKLMAHSARIRDVLISSRGLVAVCDKHGEQLSFYQGYLPEVAERILLLAPEATRFELFGRVPGGEWITREQFAELAMQASSAAPVRVTVTVAPDAAPETLAAIGRVAALAFKALEEGTLP